MTYRPCSVFCPKSFFAGVVYNSYRLVSFEMLCFCYTFYRFLHLFECLLLFLVPVPFIILAQQLSLGCANLSVSTCLIVLYFVHWFCCQFETQPFCFTLGYFAFLLFESDSILVRCFHYFFYPSFVRSFVLFVTISLSSRNMNVFCYSCSILSIFF